MNPALEAAVTVARAHGVGVQDPVVLSDSANLVLHLKPAPIVARVSTRTAEVRGEHAFACMQRAVLVGAHFARSGVAAARPTDSPPAGPHRCKGRFVTFWAHEDHDGSAALDPGSAADALRRIHEALAGCPVALPRLLPLVELPKVIERLGTDGLLTGAEAGAMSRVLQLARSQIDALELEDRALHGDAHLGNVLATPEGLRWSDFEETCAGPLEWDLACIVATARAFGTHRAAAEALLAAYGDVDEARLRPFTIARVVQSLAWGLFLARGKPEREQVVRSRLSFWLEDGWLK